MFNSHQLHRFAIRKYAVGVCSVMVASLLFLGTSRVSADQLEATAGPRTEQVADSPDQLQDQELKVEATEIAVAADIATPLPAGEPIVVEPVAESLPTPVVELISESTTVPKTEESPESATLQTAPIASKSQELTQEIKSAETQPTLTANQVVQNQQSPDGERVSALKPELDSPTELKQEKSLEQVTETKDGLDSQNKPTEPAVESPARPVKAAPTKFTLGTGFRSFGMTRSATPTGVIGDDYPDKWKHLDPNRNLDSWNLYVRNCTSFAAYRLSSVNGFELPLAFGDAGVWGENARREGYRVDNIPARGSIAWALPSATNSSYGHVAWVAAVNGDMVTVEEYNYNYLKPFTYVTRTVSKSTFTGYIHFKDLNHGAVATPPTTTTTHGLPAQGTYTFTKRTGVKNQPKLSSPDLDTYEVGEKVNYDQVLESENQVWLGYKNFAGGRNYVAIKPITPVTTSQKEQHGLPAQGKYTFTQQTGVKSEPKLSSPNQATYGIGASVNYDQVLESDNHVWLSYINYSGSRSYVAIKPLEPAAKPSPEQVSRGQLQVQNQNPQTGDFDVLITDVYHVAGSRDVQIAVWSDKDGQDDLLVYTAQPQEDDSYKVSVKVEQHKNDTGTYHIKLYYLQDDGSQHSLTETTTVVEQQAPAIPSQGVYQFTKTLPIKNQASINSATIDYYYAGETVKYDRVLTAEGRQWLSYMSRSGIRRYVPLN